MASESLSNFQNDSVDVAVRQGVPPFGPGLIADLLFKQQLVAVGSPALLGDRVYALSPDDIDRFTLLDDSHDLWPEFLAGTFGRSAAPAARHVRFNQTSLAIDMAIAGQGLAVTSRFLVEQDIAEQRLALAFEDTMRGRQDSYVVTLRKPSRPKPTEIVKRWLLAHRTT